jgi:hypothetical protein
LLEEQIPLGLMTMAARRLCAEIAQRVGGQSPMFQMPLPRLSVGSADLRPVFGHKRADCRVAVHCLQHLQPRAVQAHDRQVVIKGSEPPFVVVVLIGDEIGDAPGQEAERFSGEAEWFVSSDSWFHNRRNLFKRRSLHGGLGFSQHLKRRKRYVGLSRCCPVSLVCLVCLVPDAIDKIDQTDYDFYS